MDRLRIIVIAAAVLALGLACGPVDDGGGGGGGGGTPTTVCCKHCGTTSQPCGDTCISNTKTCHTAGGCACR